MIYYTILYIYTYIYIYIYVEREIEIDREREREREREAFKRGAFGREWALTRGAAPRLHFGVQDSGGTTCLTLLV